VFGFGSKHFRLLHKIARILHKNAAAVNRQDRAVRSTPYPSDNAVAPGPAPPAGAGSGLGLVRQPARMTIGVAGMNPLIRGTNSMRWSVSPDALEVRWYGERVSLGA
jgi:hypothetical protein